MKRKETKELEKKIMKKMMKSTDGRLYKKDE